MSGEGLLLLILLPALVGLVGSLIPKKFWKASAILLLLISGFCGGLCLKGLIAVKGSEFFWRLGELGLLGFWKGREIFRADALGMGMGLLASIICFFILVWAFGYYQKGERGFLVVPSEGLKEERFSVSREFFEAKRFFVNASWILSLSFGVFFSDHLLVFSIFWGGLCVPFYLMLCSEKESSLESAKKSFLILFATDSMLILGIALIWLMSKKFLMSELSLSTNSLLGVCAYLLMVSAGFAKAGIIPFHSWIPDASENCPTAAIALMPSALDKLLGIYFLTRASRDLFMLTPQLKIVLLVMGAITIIGGVFPALVQRHFQRLLGFHAVSQAGYMLIGLGTGTALGILGALFHMLNNVLYKSLLFLCAGELSKRTGTQDLGKLGGLYRFFPISFFSFLIASLGISGVPPLNGFFSKWLIYQSIIQLASEFPWLWVFILLSAMFGSALTLASFIKLLYSTYLGSGSERVLVNSAQAGKKLMEGSMLVLAIGCIGLGVFGYTFALKWLILPMVGQGLSLLGFWQPVLATGFLLIGLGLGAVVYVLILRGRFREDESYLLGETAGEFRYSGLDFYRTLEVGLKGFSQIYQAMEQGWFDLYEGMRRIVFYFSGLVRALQSGNLLSYIAWMVLGLVILLWTFVKLG